MSYSFDDCKQNVDHHPETMVFWGLYRKRRRRFSNYLTNISPCEQLASGYTQIADQIGLRLQIRKHPMPRQRHDYQYNLKDCNNLWSVYIPKRNRNYNKVSMLSNMTQRLYRTHHAANGITYD